MASTVALRAPNGVTGSVQGLSGNSYPIDANGFVSGVSSSDAFFLQGAGFLPPLPRRAQIVATRGVMPVGRWGNGSSGRADTRAECRIRCRVGRAAVSHLQLAMAGFYVNAGSGEANNGNDFSVEAAIELSNPAFYHRAHVNGAALATVADGIPLVTTNPPLGYDLPAGTDFYARISASVGSTSLWFPVGGALGNSDTGFASAAASSQVAATGAMTQPSGGASFSGMGPYIVLGVPASPMAAVAILGDSIADGTGDNAAGDNNGNVGFVTRGLWQVNGYPVPWIKQTRGSDTAANNQLDLGGKKRSAWPYATHLVCNLGTNDISSKSLAQIQGYLIAIWSAAKRTIGPYGVPLKTAQILLMPRTSSTDSWATAANQSPVAGFGVGGLRDQVNGWIRSQAGLGLLDASIDCNPAIEDPAHPGLWLANGSANYPTADGIHPSAAFHILAAQAVTSWAGGIQP